MMRFFGCHPKIKGGQQCKHIRLNKCHQQFQKEQEYGKRH